MAELGQVQSYRDLEVYQLAFSGAVKVHEMTMRLPKHEMYEVGSQIRRSAKGIPANIAEGFGRRRYKNEYLHFLTIALASCDETQVHLEMLHATEGLDDSTHESLVGLYSTLGRKLNRLIQVVLAQHVEPYRDAAGAPLREDGPEYWPDAQE